MKIISIAILLSIALYGCKKNVDIDKVLTNLKLAQHDILADGQTTVTMSVQLPDNSSTDRRSVIFTTSSGSFIGSGNNTVTSKAAYDNGLLLATATLKVSTQPGIIKVSVQPEYDSPLKEFTLSDSISANPSIPALLELETSSTGLGTSGLNEVLLTSFLKNAAGKFVSKGYSVSFHDFLLNGNPANGIFRNQSGPTRDSSKVTVFYAADGLPLNTRIKIKSSLLDANGQPLPISDSIFLTINQ